MPDQKQTSPKRKSPVPSRRDWEELHFDTAALEILKTACAKRNLPFPKEHQEKLDALKSKIAAQRRQPGKIVTIGLDTVKLFLHKPDLISKMFQEMQTRYAVRSKNEDILMTEISDPDLYRHCMEKANFIYTGNEYDCKDYRYSRHYRQIRSNYTETMGRAAKSASWVYDLYNKIKESAQTIAPPQPTQPSQPQPPAPPMPNRPIQRSLQGFERLVQGDLPVAQPPQAKPANPTLVQDLLPGFIMPPAEIPVRPKRVRKSTRKLRLPDPQNQRS